ncbi:MAG: erythromycin esterase family protein [Candidatus Acidiferrales bacterium]
MPAGCSQQAPPEFVLWARKNAIPITTMEPAKGFKDLQRLKQIIGSARVVGLGESVHTAHEFHRIRHRLLEFLVEQMGFTAFAMETGFAEAVKINDYVLGRVNEPERWQHNWFTWGFGYEEELLALVHWMRHYNEDPRHTRKLHFYGIDLAVPYSSPLTAVEEVQAYLGKVDPEYAASPARQNLLTLVQKFQGSGFSDDARDISLKKYIELPVEERNAYTGAIADLLARFRTNRMDYIDRSSVEDYEWAYHSGIAAQQLDAAYRGAAAATKPGSETGPELMRAAFTTRDSAMADNILWALEREGLRGRIVLWAHNSHLMKSKLADPVQGRLRAGPRLGLYLDSMLGQDYVNVGFTYYQYQGAKPVWLSEQEQKAENLPAACGTIDGELARVGLPTFVVNLHAVPRTGAMHDWLSEPHTMRESAPEWDYQLVPLRAWDALFFVQYITSAHGNYAAK